MINCWINTNGECLKKPPVGYYAFIYKITNLDNGFFYIGRKAFIHNKKVKLSKKARKTSGTKKRTEKIQKESDWQNYFGSSSYLLEDLENNNYNCKREILKFCKDKISTSFWEMFYMVENRVLFRKDCYNGHINGKWFKGKIHE